MSRDRDWVSSSRSYLAAWGVPTAIMLIAVFLDPTSRTVIWAAALAWMGIACIANASRCGRTHCYFTGRFFLLMAGAVLLHGFEILWLGDYGWWWLGVTLVSVGYGALWYLPERLWGKFVRQDDDLLSQ